MERLREIGRLLSLYLTVAHYLAGQKVPNSLSKALEVSKFAACMSSHADFEEVEYHLRKALDAFQAFMRTNPLGGTESPIKDAAKFDRLIRSGIELIEEIFAEAGFRPLEHVRYAHAHIQMAAAVLLNCFQTLPGRDADQLVQMRLQFVDPMLMSALELMETRREPSPNQLAVNLETFDLDMMQRVEHLEHYQPGLFAMNLIVMQRTRSYCDRLLAAE